MKNRRKLIIPVVILLLLGIFVYIKGKKPPTSAMALQTVKVFLGDIAINVTALGKVEAAKTQEVYAPISGNVNYIVEPGQKVKKGDIILELDNEELKHELKQAEYRLNQEKIQLEKLLKGTRAEELEKAKIKLDEAELLYNTALVDYEKNQGLYESGAISQKELEKFKEDLDLKKNQLDVARLDVTILENPDGDEIDLKENVLKEAEDEFLKIKNKLDKTIVYAQIDGIVLKTEVKSGMDIASGADILVIADPSDLEITINVNEYDVAKLKVGQKAIITGDGFGDRNYKGEIVKIAPMASTTQTSKGNETSVQVNLKILDPDEYIKPGFSVNAEIAVEDRKNVLLLPLECIIDEPEGKKVTLVKEGEPSERRVKTGIENELYVEILEGLAEGDEVYPNSQDAMGIR